MVVSKNDVTGVFKGLALYNINNDNVIQDVINIWVKYKTVDLSIMLTLAVKLGALHLKGNAVTVSIEDMYIELVNEHNVESDSRRARFEKLIPSKAMSVTMKRIVEDGVNLLDNRVSLEVKG